MTNKELTDRVEKLEQINRRKKTDENFKKLLEYLKDDESPLEFVGGVVIATAIVIPWVFGVMRILEVVIR